MCDVRKPLHVHENVTKTSNTSSVDVSALPVCYTCTRSTHSKPLTFHPMVSFWCVCAHHITLLMRCDFRLINFVACDAVTAARASKIGETAARKGEREGKWTICSAANAQVDSKCSDNLGRSKIRKSRVDSECCGSEMAHMGQQTHCLASLRSLCPW